jgi:hypothetical protein
VHELSVDRDKVRLAHHVSPSSACNLILAVHCYIRREMNCVAQSQANLQTELDGQQTMRSRGPLCFEGLDQSTKYLLGAAMAVANLLEREP